MKKFTNFLVRLKWVFLIIFMLLFGYPVGYFVLDSSELNNNPPISITGGNGGVLVFT
jgi:hypothetical protein